MTTLKTFKTGLQTLITSIYLHGCTVHVDYMKPFICPTSAHTNYSKIVELLKTFKTTITAPTCFGLYKSLAGAHSLCFAKASVLHS